MGGLAKLLLSYLSCTITLQEDDALVAISRWLDFEKIPYMVIEGFAVTVGGEPRLDVHL